MKSLYFKCTLLSDIIINQKSATEGKQLSLDFIPGNNFLGIVAQNIYPDKSVSNDVKLKLFHTGDVKFGDAHPAYNKCRALRIPACIYFPKLKKVQNESYISFLIPEVQQKEMIKKQLKQSRDGFVVVENDKFIPLDIKKNFSLKSAHDKFNRRSENNKMYGYQSLQEGMVYYFQVDIEDSSLQDYILDNLKGVHHVGRSKTAEYGSVNIDFLEQGYNTYNSSGGTISVFNKETKNIDQCVVIYADSRLIFLDDKTGLPTARPTSEQLGVPRGKILWNKSQIRTFQYAPYNSARSAYDTDRYGIEKGSVIIIKVKSFELPSSCWLGVYTNEGFGHVIYNPEFLKTIDQLTGASKHFIAKTDPIIEEEPEMGNLDEGLLDYLKRQIEEENSINKVYSVVLKFVKDNESRFRSVSFCSQWGNIRSIAMSEPDKEKLIQLLYGAPNGYLVHGKAAKKWGESDRLNNFKKFVGEVNEGYMQVAIINLASQMAKIYDNK